MIRRLSTYSLFFLMIPGPLLAQDGTTSSELEALKLQVAILEQKLKQLQTEQQINTLNNPDQTAAQNAALAQQIKLLENQQALNKLQNPDQVAQQTAVLEQRVKLLTQEQSLLKQVVPVLPKGLEGTLERKGETPVESTRLAYMALQGIAEQVATKLNCSGKNLVVHAPGHSESLLSLRAFTEQTQLLKDRMTQVRDLTSPFPEPGGLPANPSSVFGAAALAGPVLQTVLDLISLFRSNTVITSSNETADDVAVVAAISGSASGAGCLTFWPEQYAAKPFDELSAVAKRLRELASINDSPGADFANEGLQQRLARLRGAARTAATQIADWTAEIEELRANLAGANAKVDKINGVVQALRQAIKEEKDPDELKRLKEQRAKAAGNLKAAAEEAEKLAASTPTGVAALLKKKRDMEKYVNLLADLITATSAASDAYNGFRGTLLDSTSGTSALSRMLRAQALRDLLFDSNGIPIEGASILQTKVEKLVGSVRVRKSIWTSAKEDYSGGVVLSFLQYDPNGKLLNKSIHGCHGPLGPFPKEVKCEPVPPADSKSSASKLAVQKPSGN